MKRYLHVFMFMALLVAGAVSRVFLAWTLQWDPDPDYGVVALMARNIAQGDEWPVFFYGQPYMGSLEPMVSALLLRCFGDSPFWICMGTAMLAMACLPLLYLWGRLAGGPAAGLAAMALWIFAPDTVLHYSAAPRGGYMTMLLLGLATLLLAIGLGRNAAPGGDGAYRKWAALMGFCAGLAWWSNQLVIVFFLPAALLFLNRNFVRFAKDGLGWALAAALLGSAPWWAWNLQHGGASFSFSESLGAVPWREGVGLFAGILSEALECGPSPDWGERLRLAALAVLVVCAAFRAFHERRGANRLQGQSLLAAVLVFVVMLLLFSNSHYARMGATRYVLPCLPAVYVLAAVGSTWSVLSPKGIPLGLLLLVLAGSPQGLKVRAYIEDALRNRTEWQRAEQLADALEKSGTTVCAGDYKWYWMNYAGGGALTVADTQMEKYAGGARRLWQATAPVFLENHANVRAFRVWAGARAIEEELAGFPLVRGLRLPELRAVPVDGLGIEAIALDPAVPCAWDPWRLHDGRIGGAWNQPVEYAHTNWCQWRFAGRPAVDGLVLLSNCKRPPMFTLEVADATSGVWRTVLPAASAPQLFVSGPRLRAARYNHVIPMMLPGDEPYFDSIRVGATRKQPLTACDLDVAEVVFVSRTGADAPEHATAPVAEWLAHAAEGDVYVPRWVADAFEGTTYKNVRIHPESPLGRRVNDLPERYVNGLLPVWLTNRVTFLMTDAARVAAARAAAEECGCRTETAALGAWTAVSVDPAGRRPEYDLAPGVIWSEAGVFGINPERYAKHMAQGLYQRAMRMSSGDAAVAAHHLEEALRLYPAHAPAARMLAALRGQPAPGPMVRETPLARFGNGLALMTFSSSVTNQDGRPCVVYQCGWRVPADYDPTAWNVFVHVVPTGGESYKPLFQDDHAFWPAPHPELWNYQPFDEVFTHTRSVPVPSESLGRDVELLIGVVSTGDRERVRLETQLPEHKSSVRVARCRLDATE